MSILSGSANPLIRKLNGKFLDLREKAQSLAVIFGVTPGKDLYYIVDSFDWSIYWDGVHVTMHAATYGGMSVQLRQSPWGLRDSVIHFGSQFTFMDERFSRLHPSNMAVVTYFHGDVDDPDPSIRGCARAFPERQKRAAIVVTSCEMVRKRLVSWGIPEPKIVKIPLGIDLTLFSPVSEDAHQAARAKLGIPEGAICVGSFQKDGVGWGKGAEPKLIKGPDVFLSAVERMSKKHDLFVLLTGPSRGYVVNGLKKLNVPHRHVYLKEYHDIIHCYHALDVYLITSRDEGGPKAVLESMASGVPVVSTRVGMAPDVIENGKNGYLADIGDAQGIADHADSLISRSELRRMIIENGYATVKNFSWENISRQYFQRVYSCLLKR